MESQEKSIKKLVEGHELEICFYGKVVDSLGNPVSGAKISASVVSYSRKSQYGFSPKAIVVESGNDGIFIINNMKGMLLAIDDIHCDLYSYNLEDNPVRSFMYSNLTHDAYVPGEKNPELFIVRDVSKGVWLESVSMSKRCCGLNRRVCIDLLRKKIRYLDRKSQSVNNVGFYSDLEIEYEFDKDLCRFEISASRDTEVVVADDRVAVMPDTGYIRKYKDSFLRNTSKEVYLYVYANNRNISAVFRLGLFPRSYKEQDCLRISFIGDANWYGTKYLHKKNKYDIPKELRMKEQRKLVLESLRSGM